MKRQAIIVCLAAAGILAAPAARAEHTRYWRESDLSDFNKGTAKGVAVRSDGKLEPAPKFSDFADPNLAYLWALGVDSHKRLYAAGGSDAKVLRFDEAGKATTVFESSELSAQAIAFDANDNLYVGTSPDGKVYKVTPDGQKSVFFEPRTKYIWALAMDSRGDLFVATGDKGQVFVVGPDGKGQLFYQSDEQHARCLAFDSKGSLLIGTDPDGEILRVGVARDREAGLPKAGASFVIYQTNRAEVTSLVEDASGDLYAASVGQEPHPPRINAPAAPPPVIAPQAVVQATTPSQGIMVEQPVQPQRLVPYPILPPAGGGAEVVKIAPDGSPETIWTSREDIVYATAFSGSKQLLLGTGEKGTVVQLDGGNVYSTIAHTESAQVTALLGMPGGKVFVATANPGKVFTLGPGYQENGSFESDAFDAKIFSHWGRLAWWGENGATDGKVEFYVRSGNTSNPEKNWSAWSGPYKGSDVQNVECPAARFAQWKAVFRDTDSGGAPQVSWVELAYQPKNVAPEIDDIAIQDPGIRLQAFGPAGGEQRGNVPVALRMPQRAEGAFSGPPAEAEPPSLSRKIVIPPQGFEDQGYQSVIWTARDENDDDLTYTVYYRGEGEKNWRLLKDKLAQPYYSWDTRTMPDGAYDLKIVASDAPSNPPDQALTAERVSDRFEIANTPPEIERLRATPNAGGAKLTFDGASASDSVARAQYSVDAGDWEIVFPVGLLSDARQESYSFDVTGLSPGEHTLAVEIFDRFGNTAAAKVTFIVSAGAP